VRKVRGCSAVGRQFIVAMKLRTFGEGWAGQSCGVCSVIGVVAGDDDI
jgi:hypothetical protein